MIINLDPSYRDDYCQTEACNRWDAGNMIEYNVPFSIDHYPIAFVKGDFASQIESDHTSIRMTEFTEFAEQCTGKVYLGTARLVFGREIVIGFNTESDAIAFKLKFA